VLASEAALEQAGTEEAARWRVLDEVTLRGRSTPTKVAAPRS
jgi:adenylate cyclase